MRRRGRRFWGFTASTDCSSKATWTGPRRVIWVAYFLTIVAARRRRLYVAVPWAASIRVRSRFRGCSRSGQCRSCYWCDVVLCCARRERWASSSHLALCSPSALAALRACWLRGATADVGRARESAQRHHNRLLCASVLQPLASLLLGQKSSHSWASGELLAHSYTNIKARAGAQAVAAFE